MSIIPQALAALILVVLLSLGALYLGTNAPREMEKVHPVAVCTTGTTPVKCVGN